MPQVFILGGPNGAGKTTAANVLLPDFVRVTHFVNADQIAAGLSAFDPESVALEAGRIMLARLKTLAGQKMDFAFETTLASRTFAPWLRELQGEGYLVHLIYLWVPTAEMAIERVARRVEAGGHHIPSEVVRRRYERGRTNFFELYAPLADTWRVFDTSGVSPLRIASRRAGEEIRVLDQNRWRAIMKEEK